jgi:hypothetical protein
MHWLQYSKETILNGKDEDGFSLLGFFLKDYEKEFSTKANAGCNKCLNNYIDEYFNKFLMMEKEKENKCDYLLFEKYEGISLEFGSAIHVTNLNITNEYALKLLERFHPTEKYFAKFPKETKSKK